MSTVGERLREERQRLGLSQDDFAARGGVQRRAQINYEKDERLPDAGYLAAIGHAGVDVLYVVMGIRAAAYLTPRESHLLTCYRLTGEPGKRAIENAASALANVPPPEHGDTESGGSRQQFYGQVGQVGQGDIINQLSPDKRKK